MITLRLLGPADLLDSNGQVLDTLLRQPKRFALLVFLSAARPCGFHRRDKLVDLFWAESTQDQARRALNQALFVLRTNLGTDAIVSRGDDEIALNSSVISVDVAAFRTALEAGDLECALQSYRGGLLEAFFVPGAPGFEHWVEQERAHLNRRAVEAAWTLGERNQQSGDVFGAIEWARRAFGLAPFDEVVLRRLLELLDVNGDRAGAVRVYQQFARNLAEEFELEPSPETRELLEQIRRREPQSRPDQLARDVQRTEADQDSDQFERLKKALADRYQIEREIGRGGTATVYLALDLKHHRKVAVKVPHPALTLAVSAERFIREIEIAANLSHPNIVPVLDSGEADGFFYYVMPYIQGESLRERLNREHQLTLDETIKVTSEIADALKYAHDCNVVHRDIKPENILLQAGHCVVADFGLALAVGGADRDRLTESGIAVGTPEYMSPEQCGGVETPIDGRSDIYATGCVIYEMLIGEPPFHGPDARAICARHMLDEPPSLRNVRPQLPAPVEEVVHRALAKSPADRFQTANQLATDLEEAALHPIEESKPPVKLLLGLIGVTVLATATLLLLLLWPPPASLNPALHVVLPFTHLEGAAPQLFTGEQCEREIYDALRSWEDVLVVNPLLVNDVLTRRGIRGATAGVSSVSLSVELALDIAKELGAGRLIWGLVREAVDGIEVVGMLYDVQKGVSLDEHSINLPQDPTALSEPIALKNQFGSLADRLIGGERFLERPENEVTRSWEAWEAFDAGQAALAGWNLGRAEHHFAKAVAADPEWSLAAFWLARVRFWAHQLRSAPPTWDVATRQALSAKGALSQRERAEATAMLALAEDRLEEACNQFEVLIDQNASDFAAWFGLGECTGRDDAVIKDSTSPTGWSFRGSWHRAITAHLTALELAPSLMLAFEEEVNASLYHYVARPSTLRVGRAIDADSVIRFGAYPGLDADTLSFVPYYLEDAVTLREETVPKTVAAAQQYYWRLLQSTVDHWLVVAPKSFRAQEAQARLFEERYQLTGKGPSALKAIHAARELAPTGEDSARVMAAEIRLLLKLTEWESAKHLADSLLEMWREPTDVQAYWLAGVAAVTGRARSTVKLLEIAVDETIRRSPWARGREDETIRQVILEGERFRGFVSLGVSDSLHALASQVDSVLNLLAPSAPISPQRLRQFVMDANLTWAFAFLGASELHRDQGADRVLVMQYRFAAGDTEAVRKEIDRFHRVQSNWPAGQAAIDDVYQETLLLLAMGDTTEAIKNLDRSLNALGTFTHQLLREVPQAGHFVRAMALRAQLASRLRDGRKVHQWSVPVTVLWSDADEELRPLVDGMRTLVR